jgi:DNA-binding PadR family transcriptional regulator
MARTRPLAVAVLGLLQERPRHPYDIAFTMQTRRMDQHIKLSMGTLYHVVEQLQRLGWVEPTETAREGRRPERTIYAVTPEGLRQLLQRLRELVAEPTQEYSSFEAGLTFIHQLPRDEAVALLRRRTSALLEQIDLWDYTLERLGEKGVTRLALLEAEMVQDTRRFHAEWALRIADEIESGRLEWTVACSTPPPSPQPTVQEAAGGLRPTQEVPL